ncbi:MAG: hypothetical protein ABUL49_00785, partial [bacterium]
MSLLDDKPGASSCNYPWVLLMTATVNPRGTILTERTDVQTRIDDYLASLKFWFSATDIPIVFCENSAGDMKVFEEFGKDRKTPFEILSFDCPPYDPKKGKGYGEVEIFKYAIANSKLIGPDTRIIKVTGRYQVLNFKSIFRHMQKMTFDICIDLRYSLRYSDCRLFAATVEFFETYLFPESEKIDDTVTPPMSLEHVLAYATLRAIADGSIQETIPNPPFVWAVAGTTG